ncbi:MAG TPA: hypothetical protein VNV44_05370 [Solirubrobacteraceae bacterium]|jgi:hypothetical protein|nr:hypothetical protein [Solirubrobacteraceae bacterium]
MARASKRRKKKLQEGKGAKRLAVPWALLQGTIVVGGRWGRLSANERERLTALLRDSRGRIDRLSSRERKELRKLVDKLDLKGMAKELIALRAVRKSVLRRR